MGQIGDKTETLFIGCVVVSVIRINTWREYVRGLKQHS